MPETIRARLLLDCRNILAEGIQWHGEQNKLYWTDIHGRALWSCNADGSGAAKTDFEKRIGSFAFTDQGTLVIAHEDGLAHFDPGNGGLRELFEIEADLPTTRLNDGRCDRDGRFVFGGLDEDGLRPLSGVYSFAGGTSATPLITEVGCTNSLCFSPDGTRMYFADSSGKRIYRYAYDRATGAVSDRAVFAELGNSEGAPDGSCVDAEGGVWNAQFEGGCVQRFLPDGTRDIRIELPVSQVTLACFGGGNLDTLFIATAREGFSPERQAEEPTAGGIYVAELDGIRGLPEERFRGRLPL
ncbi:SMP-30/gluconolactonase/LRE family protein [Nisaea acidiphila]|uniref:SMP-30/gluconolactonase/LRE family protein n=1 Tax=Nisaea acidiphila TaxID=1862145 RepID=A0A9J7ATX0_9PROT|nr:SMP-30/gluconolactonase/LRE family protein [Nisaea acidiphila]UUX49937.1 SMP-30/gluconolactonase/LRE family protein [Nisaea acidiphila]